MTVASAGARMWRFTLTLLALGACVDDRPATLCGRCDADAYCVYYGSDVSTEPSTHTCEALPDDCSSCDCLLASIGEDHPLRWCAEFGCEAMDGTPVITCPGG